MPTIPTSPIFFQCDYNLRSQKVNVQGSDKMFILKKRTLRTCAYNERISFAFLFLFFNKKYIHFFFYINFEINLQIIFFYMTTSNVHKFYLCLLLTLIYHIFIFYVNLCFIIYLFFD